MKPFWRPPAGSNIGLAPVLRLVRSYRAKVVALSLVSFGGAIFEAAMLVLLTGSVLATAENRASIQIAGQKVEVGTALIVVGLMLGARLALALLGVALSARLSVNVLGDLRDRIGEAFLGASWEAQQAEPAGRFQELMTTFVNHSTQAVKSFTNWLTAWLSLAAFLIAAVIVDPLATLFVLAALLVLGGVLFPARRAIRRRSAVTARTGLAFTNAVSELGGLGLEMQVYGVKEGFLARIQDLSWKNMAARFRVQVLSEALSPIYMALAYAGVVLGVVVLTRHGTANLASVGAVLLLMLRSLAYGQGLQGHSGSIASAVSYVIRLEDALRSYQDDAATDGEVIGDGVTPLELETVDFAYSPDRLTLRDVTLRIEPNEIVGVIGPSGAGKSTLVQLLLGLREPTLGEVTVGGIDLKSVNRQWWTKRVSMVAQDAHLFTGTVAENIRFFRDGIDGEAIQQSLADANLLADIEALSLGPDTHLGERAGQLSGGQRQRLSIARALAGQTELLILDEPTSALDVQSESLIRDSLAKLRGRATVVIIAHRMSTLDICDRILVIEDGQVTGFDTPERLYDQNAFYRSAMDLATRPVIGRSGEASQS